ncbi:MAG TPA: glycosyltransferase family 39 protein [Verrucomicrobiae bacterium]|jgi:4-amino-4-deoxy-L-arabinose transferase-like glycosyltransferase|nr:glycosyltransferase family 39 protein [Verrucomicrobiae bacterium]
MESIFKKLTSRPQVSLICLGLLILLAGNWILPLTDRDEARFSEASREMIQRSDYIVPWFNGEWRLYKPALIYWCQIASYRVLGVNDFSARLPSVLFTVGTALLLFRWGRKIADAKTGFLAGAMFLTGLHMAVIGRIATADLALIFFFTLSAWSGWELTRPAAVSTAPGNGRAGLPVGQGESAMGQWPASVAVAAPPGVSAVPANSRWKWWLIFYVSLGFGFLAKGPEAWLPLGVLILGRALRKDSFRLPLAETVAGIVVPLAMIAAWGIPALEETHGMFWKVGMNEQVYQRAVNINNSHGLSGILGFVLLLPLYFLTFFASFFPWSLRVPEALGRWWRERQRDIPGWYLFMVAAAVFIVFSLVKTKLPHYTAPAFPLIALWLARQISNDAQLPAWFVKRLAAMVIFILVLMLGVTSYIRGSLLTLNLWHATRAYVTPATRVGCYGYVEPSLVWEFRNVITNTVVLGDEKAAKDFLTNQPPYILVLPTQDVASLPDTNGLQIKVHGLDMVRFKNRDLTAIVRQAQ